MQFIYQAGDQPLDGYTIRKPLGHGGFGEVYHAVSEAGKEVALKLVQRFLDVELRGVTQCLNLKHPNLVTIYDLRTNPAEEHWIIMEYIDGPMLSDVLARHPQGLPQDKTLHWLEGIAAGVGYLHDKGLVHRDLKPGNVFVEDGTVKVGDYGLSKFITVSRRSGQTQSVGTVHYMAPEIGSGRYGPEVDIYSLGIMLYEMLTGDVPFDGETPTEILMKHLSAEPDLTRVPVPFQPVVGRMLAKQPEDRYGSVQDVLDDAHRYLANPSLAETFVVARQGDASAEPERQRRAVAGAPAQWAAGQVGGAAQLGAVAQPRDADTLSWLIPTSSTRRRWSESLREHPILWPFCLFLLIALVIGGAVWDGDSGIFGRQLSKVVFQSKTGGVYENLAWAYLGWGAIFCFVVSIYLFVWRYNSSTPGMLPRQREEAVRRKIAPVPRGQRDLSLGDEAEYQAILSAVRGPSIGLIVVGILGLLLPVLLTIVALGFRFFFGQS